jgi:putative glutamine amidotransferase
MRVPKVGIPARLANEDGTRDAVADELFDLIVEQLGLAGTEVTVITDETEDLSQLDGFLLPGGGDVDPALYGEAGATDAHDVNLKQDALDLRVLSAADSASKPILAICRGAQLLNVHRGGTLHTDLPASSVAHRDPSADDPDEAWVWHEVSLEPGSELAREFGTPRMHVASAHHQGIDRIGSGLKPIAITDDGLVEGVEGTGDGQWTLGIQWHPEFPGTETAVQSLPFELFAREL